MNTRYLALPFFQDIKDTSLHATQTANVGLKSRFKLYTRFDALLPFVCEVQYCTFQVVVRDFNGEVCASVSEAQIKHKIFTKNGKNYMVYNGERIGCMELGECRLPYTIQIGNFHSEWFWVAEEVEKLLKIEIGNSTDLTGVPYSTGFKQFFYLESNLGRPEVDSFSISSRDARGNVQTTYQKLTETYNFYFLNVPHFVKNCIASFEVLDTVKVVYRGETVVCEERQAKVKSKRNELGFDFYDVEFSIVNKDTEEIGICQVSSYQATPCETVVPIEIGCFEINAIEEIITDCEVTNEIEKIEIDCEQDCESDQENEILFYATVNYLL